MLSRFKILQRKEKISLGILNKSCHAEKPRKTPSIHRQPDKFPGDTRFAPSPVTVPGSPFSISARRAISGRPLVEGERQREKEARTRGSALTPRRIISVSTDPSFWPARIFRPLRPTNFDQLTRKGMGSHSFSAGARICPLLFSIHSRPLAVHPRLPFMLLCATPGEDVMDATSVKSNF